MSSCIYFSKILFYFIYIFFVSICFVLALCASNSFVACCNVSKYMILHMPKYNMIFILFITYCILCFILCVLVLVKLAPCFVFQLNCGSELEIKIASVAYMASKTFLIQHLFVDASIGCW